MAGLRDHGSSREASRWIAFALRSATFAMIAFVLAGPVARQLAPPEPGRGIDLVLVIDASASMAALDTSERGNDRTRLELARSAVLRFARERVAIGDRVGLVVFGETAFTLCPLTSDGALLAAAVERVRVGMAGDTTALGDALALAVKRARGAGGAAPGLVVLLTDGRSNAGSLPLAAAASLAREHGVRVHAVAIGSETDGVAVQDVTQAATGRLALRIEHHAPDPAALEAVTTHTGGTLFPVTHASELRAVYRSIDAIERPARVLPPRVLERPTPEPWLAGAGLFLLGEITWLRVARRRLP